jgi:hypothetical protein
MKNESISRSPFFNPRILVIGVILVLALVVRANPQAFIRAGARHPNTQERHPDRVPLASPGGGQEAWVARYNGPGNDVDEAEAIGVDDAGNAYVTGYSSGSDGLLDYATIKYDSAGQQQWVARYNGPGNSYDVAIAIDVDSAGNVYVTGESVGSGTGFDYATVKYDSAGQQQWVARYNGPGNGMDEAAAIVVDDAGNVYVTGNSLGSDSGVDYATIKYNSAGQEQWVARYNGPGNGNDYPMAIDIDSAGDVYVTGHSFGSGSGYDYATVKYDSAGQQQWVARYNGPGNDVDEAEAIAVDGSGNAYVTGGSMGSTTGLDSATIKYNSAGEEQWVARYNGPANSHDFAEAIALDDLNNVYVAGTTTSETMSHDYATIKYDAAGQEMWVARYTGTGAGENEADDLAVDSSGNVYVTGNSLGFGSGSDYATVKYNTMGQEQWTARYNGPGNGDDFATGIAVDSLHNVYVAGRSTGSGTAFDYATIKYIQISTPTPTPTAIATPTPTATVTPVPSATPTTSPRVTPTPRPRPSPQPRP